MKLDNINVEQSATFGPGAGRLNQGSANQGDKTKTEKEESIAKNLNKNRSENSAR
jgi:hypothetical protein